MRVLVLGGYGLIGSAVVEALLAEGHAVSGLGREIERARLRWPEVAWRRADLATLTTVGAWAPLLLDVEAVVNAAGVLQDGLGDRQAAVQREAMRALYAAVPRDCRVVQISAVGADPGAPTPFLRTKGEADRALADSGLAHAILRPGLVVSPLAYGGTALLRGLAAFPGVLPLVLADRPVQTVSAEDVALAVAAAVRGEVEGAFDLVEDGTQPLSQVVMALRRWMGLAKAPVIALPDTLGVAVSRVADGLGGLGWRSPLRTTALTTLRAGVTGDPEPWRRATGRGLGSLAATLGRTPGGVQALWFARLWLLKPVILATLSLFWVVSGLVGLTRIGAAAALLSGALAENAARATVLGGGLADLAVGLLVLFRPTARPALLGMIGLSLGYMIGAAVLAPALWIDPLGPMVKVLPGIVLALVGLAVLEDR